MASKFTFAVSDKFNTNPWAMVPVQFQGSSSSYYNQQIPNYSFPFQPHYRYAQNLYFCNLNGDLAIRLPSPTSSRIWCSMGYFSGLVIAFGGMVEFFNILMYVHYEFFSSTSGILLILPHKKSMQWLVLIQTYKKSKILSPWIAKHGSWITWQACDMFLCCFVSRITIMFMEGISFHLDGVQQRTNHIMG